MSSIQPAPPADSTATRPPLSALDSSKAILEEKLSTKSREELYREIFNSAPPPLPKQMEVTLIVDGELLGEVELFFSQNREDFSIPVQPIIQKLSQIVTADLVNDVRTNTGQNERIAQSVLTSLGLKTEFNKNRYEVKITVPTTAYLKRVHFLNGSVPNHLNTSQSIKPDFISAFVNFQTTEQLKYRQILSNNLSPSESLLIRDQNRNLRQPVYCGADGALNIFNAVLEGAASFREGGQPLINREDVSLTYDIPSLAMRITAGDLRAAFSGSYQSSMRMAGISISKDYSLQPYLLTYPVSEYEFYLNDPAEVEVWVNDIMVQRLTLEAGTHDIRGFPFSTGNNRIRILIKDYTGRRDTLQYSFLHQPTLLARGKTRYSCVAGFPNRMKGEDYGYQTRKPGLSITLRRGISDQFTTLLGSQAFISDSMGRFDLRSAMLELGGLHAFPIGMLEWDAAGTFSNTLRYDFAARLEFSFQTRVSYKNAAQTNTNIASINTPIVSKTQIEYIGRNFVKNQYDALIQTRDALRFSTDLSVPLGDRVNVNLAAKYYLRRDTTNILSTYILLNKGWLNRLNTNLTFQYSINESGNEANPAIIANIQWGFRSGTHDFGFNEEIRKRRPGKVPEGAGLAQKAESNWDFNTGLNWLYDNPEPRPEKIFASANALFGPQINDYNIRLGYNGNRGSIEAMQNLDEPQDSGSMGKYLHHLTSLNFKTSLVWAGNGFGLSRPVYNGFVLVRGVKNLSKKTITINPNPLGYDAISGWSGPAILPLYSAYQRKQLKLSSIDAPMSSGDQNFSPILFPLYKSGFTINLGSERSVVLIGTLLNSNGKPYAYKAITIQSKSNKNEKPIRTFTNTSGRFQFLGHEKSSYQIATVEDEGIAPISISVPEEKGDFHSVGTLSFTSGQSSIIADTIGLVDPEKNNLTDTTAAPQTTMTRPIPEPPAETHASKRIDTEEPSTYVSGVLYTADSSRLGYAYISIISLEDLRAPGNNTFSDINGEFQAICAKPGRYKTIVAYSSMGATMNFSTHTFNIPPEKQGFFYQLQPLVIENKSAGTTSGKDVLKKTAIEGALLLSQGIYVHGSLIGELGLPLGFTTISVTPLDNPTAPVIKSFTDRNGGFRIICPFSGHYRISYANLKDGPVTSFVVPPMTKGLYDIGKQSLLK